MKHGNQTKQKTEKENHSYMHRRETEFLFPSPFLTVSLIIKKLLHCHQSFERKICECFTFLKSSTANSLDKQNKAGIEVLTSPSISFPQ